MQGERLCAAVPIGALEHGCFLKSMYLGTAATGFHVTRLTEASFIVSTPKQSCARRSYTTDARKSLAARKHQGAILGGSCGTAKDERSKSGVRSPLDRKEERVSGLRGSLAERGDGLVRIRSGETIEQVAIGRAHLTIEIRPRQLKEKAEVIAASAGTISAYG